MAELRVQIGSVTFWGLLIAQDNGEGFQINPDGFSGWDDGVDMRRDTSNMPQAFGSFDVPGFGDSRVLSLTGYCFANTPERLGWWRSRLTGIGGDGGLVRVSVLHEGLTLWGDARLASKTKFDVMGSVGWVATYQLQLWFANPRKFGNTAIFAGGVAASHYGNFPATPMHTVTGSAASGYTINGPAGKAFVVTTPVVAGHPHTVDMATGFLTVDGAIVVGGVTQGDTWAIPGGSTATHTLTVPVGSAVLSTAVIDTYI